MDGPQVDTTCKGNVVFHRQWSNYSSTYTVLYIWGKLTRLHISKLMRDVQSGLEASQKLIF